LWGRRRNGPSGDRHLPEARTKEVESLIYSPLRALNKVSWEDESSARVLKAAAEVKEAEEKGEVKIERPGMVVNMPFPTWPGGHR
jgi:hypothetical protein